MKQVLSIRDLAIIYNKFSDDVNAIERRQQTGWDKDGKSKYETDKELEYRLEKDNYYQDAKRIKEALGTLNVEIDTPDLKIEEDK